MLNMFEPRVRLVMSRLAFAMLATFALAIVGCEGDTPTGPTEQAENPLIRRVAIDDTLGAVGGVVFNDMNQNGTLDEGEPGLEGLELSLAGPTGMTWSATTDTAGAYLFDDLEPAFYTLTAPTPEGWVLTTPANVQVKVNASELALVDHGLYQEEITEDTGGIDGIVFDDANQNGMMDEGEMGLEGLTVGLVLPDETNGSTTTDVDGNYAFADLLPGDYTVVAPMVEGWMLTTPDSVAATVIADTTVTVVFGLYMEDTSGDMGSVSGTVFDDANGNGMQDEGEMGLEGLTVGLLDADGKSSGAETDADGHYAFADLLPGDYTVVGPMVEGWTLTTPDSVTVQVTADMPVEVDFGLMMDEMPCEETSIGGMVYEDLNHNGMYDEGEPGIAGVEVRLSSRNNPRNVDTRKGSGIHRYATTGEDGTYLFEDVRPGKWRVMPKKPHGYHRSSSKDICVHLEECEAIDDADFGFTMKDDDCDDDEDDDEDDEDDCDDDDDDDDEDDDD